MPVELRILIMAVCALATVISGGVALYKLGPYKKQISGAEQIIRKRVFKGVEPVRKELVVYFDNLRRYLNKATWAFVLALLIFLLLFKGLPSKAIVLALFLVPLLVLIITRMEMRRNKKEFTDQLNDESQEDRK